MLYWIKILSVILVNIRNVANGRNNLMMHNEDARKRQIQSVTVGAVNHDR